MSRGRKGSSGQRSGAYARDRMSNWTAFDPAWSEVQGLSRSMRPLATVNRVNEAPLPIFAVATHDAFIRPCEPKEVREVLERVPQQFIAGLRRVVILGGTSKQAKAARARYFGCYTRSADIYLFAYLRARQRRLYRRHPKPDVLHEYIRAGALVRETADGLLIEFEPAAIRRFYLHDVLLHEVGHHVDEHVFERDSASAERYAEWFVRERARVAREASESDASERRWKKRLGASAEAYVLQ